MSKSSSENIDKSFEIELSELKLVIITVDTKILNIKFKVDELIPDILNLISCENNNKFILHDDILRIGCNYGEFKSKKYIELTTVVKKSNRGRKKKEKKESNRKKQGNGEYFNSQITFTILDSVNRTKFYHVKLYTNGTIQIPAVCNEDITTIHYLIDYIIEIIKHFDYIKINKDEDIVVNYEDTRSTMRNYSFSPINQSLQIDLKKFHLVIKNFKYYYDNDKNIEKNSEFYLDFVNTDLYKKYDTELSLIPISQIKFNDEKNSGLVIKFHTPIESKLSKTTTAIIFASSKFSLYGCNDKNQANIIKNILYRLLFINKLQLLYIK